ncbi:hypothetical protein [Phaeodactylibacter luteus]|uniref:T9SS type A sorting domain-containing protein n=1 Tax=Phaeodactylibacter luteus TaxID=1564516 RepID=A0A5C6RNM0_9BACT|nr:hypothetical protein [Phaeodactylibacter luteus]TXB63574.1 hypothetical protein FRY97_08595 [Phaeodactylibacter luteus]
MKNSSLIWFSACLFFGLLAFKPQTVWAQSASQGNVYISGGQEMAILGLSHYFENSSNGDLPGMIQTQRSAPQGYVSFFGSAEALRQTDAAHVDGYVKKYGNTAFSFPVGDGTVLRQLSISAPTNANDAYAVAWLPGDPSSVGDPSDGGALHSILAVGDSLASVSPAGQWDWLALSGTGEGLSITVSIPDMTGFAEATDLRLAGWDGGQWVALGTTGATGLAAGSTLTGTMMAGISAIGIGQQANSPPLPVRLSSFVLRKEGESKSLLAWSTATEQDNDFFTVERSGDGRNYHPIGQIDGAGTSQAAHYYSYLDHLPLAGWNYYRLLQTDYDGAREVISEGRLWFSGQLPQVFKAWRSGDGQLTVQFRGEAGAAPREVQLVALTGQVLQSWSWDAAPGLQQQTFSPGRLPRSTYLLRMIMDGQGAACQKLMW